MSFNYNEFVVKCLAEIKNSGISPEVAGDNITFIESLEVGEFGEQVVAGELSQNNIRNILLGWEDRTATQERSLALINWDFKAAMVFRSYDGRFFNLKPAAPRPKYKKRDANPEEAADDKRRDEANGHEYFADCQRTRFEKTPSGYIKYEQPAGCEPGLFLPNLPLATRQAVKRIASDATKHFTANFNIVSGEENSECWDLIRRFPSLFPIYVTEGAKKALAMVSIGHIAVALTSCTTGLAPREEDEFGIKQPRRVMNELAELADGRVIGIFFDNESDKKKSNYVRRQGQILISKLKQAHASPKTFLALWNPEDGKGIDDFIVGFSNRREAINEVGKIIATSHYGRKKEIAVNIIGSDIEPFLATDTTGGYIGDELKLVLEPDEIVAIIAPTGSGKTTLIKKQIRSWVDDDGAVLIITATNNLGKQIAQETGGTHRHDFTSSKMARTAAAGSGIMVCCPDSLSQMINDYSNEQKLLVFIDEADQVANHCTSAATLGGRQLEALTALETVCSQASVVVIAEADIPNRTLCFWQRLAKKELRVHRHLIETNRRDVTTVGGSVSAYIAEILRRLGAGERLVIPCDSQAAIRVLARMIEAAHPDLTGLVVHKDTTYQPLIQELITRPDETLARVQADYLIYSPSCKSGWSLNAEGYQFDRVMGLFRTLTVTEDMQLMARYRGHCPWSIFIPDSINPKGYEQELSMDSAVKAQAKKLFELNWNLKADLKFAADETVLSLSNRHFLEAAVRAGAEKRLARCFIEELLMRDGHEVISKEPGEKNPAVFFEYRNTQLAIEKEDAAAIALTKLTDEDDLKSAIRMEKKESMTPADRFTARKIRLVDSFPGVDFDDSNTAYYATRKYGRIQKSISRLACLFNPESARQKDAFQLAEASVAPSAPVQHALPNRYPAAALGVYLELDKFFTVGQSYSDNSATIKGLWDVAFLRREEVWEVFHFTVNKEVSPIKVFTFFAKWFGVSLVRTRGAGQTIHQGKSLYTVASETEMQEQLDAAEEQLEGIEIREASGLTKLGYEEYLSKKAKATNKVAKWVDKIAERKVFVVLYNSFEAKFTGAVKVT